MVEPRGAPIAALAESTTESHRVASAVTTDDVVIVIVVRRGAVWRVDERHEMEKFIWIAHRIKINIGHMARINM